MCNKIADYAYKGALIDSFVIEDGVSELGNYAFYNCRELKSLSFGESLSVIGSDAFMNCTKLHTIEFRGMPANAGTLQKILAQLSSEVEVIFTEKGDEVCRLLFPEYLEYYDEIGPAHVFGRHIDGEGFRARQCFSNNGVDFKAYDGIWAKASCEEKEATLCVLAANRLGFPIDLSEEMQNAYSSYVREHESFFVEDAIKTRRLERLRFLFEKSLLSLTALGKAVGLASREGWAEGVAEIMACTQKKTD